MKTNETNQNKSDRRSFISSCVKLSIGASFIGLSSQSFANITDSYLDYGYCIYKCPQPCSYNAACGGCRANNSLTCTTRACAIAKGLLSCAHCSELANCNKELWINYPGQRQFALAKQKEWKLMTGIDNDLKREVFNVYPNTTDSGFTICNTNQKTVSFRLIDINGRTMNIGNFNSEEYYVDISNLQVGTYILNIIKDNELLYISRIKRNSPCCRTN